MNTGLPTNSGSTSDALALRLRVLARGLDAPHPMPGRAQADDASSRRLTALARGFEDMLPTSVPREASDPLAQLGALGWSRMDDGVWRLVNSDGTFVALADPPAVVRLPSPGVSISYGDVPANTFDSHERLLQAAQNSLVDFARRVMMYGPTAMAAASTAAWTADPVGMRDWAVVVLAVALDPRLENKDAAKARADYKAVARLLRWHR